MKVLIIGDNHLWSKAIGLNMQGYLGAQVTWIKGEAALRMMTSKPKWDLVVSDVDPFHETIPTIPYGQGQTTPKLTLKSILRKAAVLFQVTPAQRVNEEIGELSGIPLTFFHAPIHAQCDLKNASGEIVWHAHEEITPDDMQSYRNAIGEIIYVDRLERLKLVDFLTEKMLNYLEINRLEKSFDFQIESFIFLEIKNSIANANIAPIHLDMGQKLLKKITSRLADNTTKPTTHLNLSQILQTHWEKSYQRQLLESSLACYLLDGLSQGVYLNQKAAEAIFFKDITLPSDYLHLQSENEILKLPVEQRNGVRAHAKAASQWMITYFPSTEGDILSAILHHHGDPQGGLFRGHAQPVPLLSGVVAVVTFWAELLLKKAPISSRNDHIFQQLSAEFTHPCYQKILQVVKKSVIVTQS